MIFHARCIVSLSPERRLIEHKPDKCRCVALEERKDEAQSHKKHFPSPFENFLLKSRSANVKLYALLSLLNENEFCTLERFRLRSRKHHQLK